MGAYKRLVFTDTFLSAMGKLTVADHKCVMDTLAILDRDPENPALNAHSVNSIPSDSDWIPRRFMAANTRDDPSLHILYLIETGDSRRVIMLTCYRPEAELE